MVVLRETRAFENMTILFSCRELTSSLVGLTVLTVVRRGHLGLMLKSPVPEGKGAVQIPSPA